MKRPLLFVLLFLLASSTFAAHLISYEEVAYYDHEFLAETWKKRNVPESLVPISYEVRVYRIIYQTKWVDGSDIEASGYYFMPQDLREPAPTMVYHHGTRLDKRPEWRLGGEETICTGSAATGYLVVRPDYIGLGSGEKTHLYHHVESEALSSIDMMRAVRELNEKLEVEASEQLFLTGYSQGGHATMALHRVIQRDYPEEFPVTASAPMSGAYDLAGAQESRMFKPYSDPGYLPFIIFSYNKVYHFAESSSEIFISPYDSLLPPLFDGHHSMREVNQIMPAAPIEAMRPEMISAYQNNEDFPLREALRENSVHNWKPEAPVLMCYCKNDEQVSWKNAKIARKTMRKLGAKHVRSLHVARKFQHGECALFAVMHVKLYFDSFLKGSKNGRLGPLKHRALIRLGKWSTTPRWKKERKKRRKAEKARRKAERKAAKEE